MKNIVCPISVERVSEHIPRVTAFYVSSLFFVYILTGFLPIILFLALDFMLRGFAYSQFSVLNKVAIYTSKSLKLSSPQIDKAPKLFAARLGGIMSLLVLSLHLAGITVGAISISTLVLTLSGLEFAFSFCVGCYMYSWVVLPLFSKKKNYLL